MEWNDIDYQEGGEDYSKYLNTHTKQIPYFQWLLKLFCESKFLFPK